MKKFLIPTVVLLLLAFLITGCGTGSPTTTGPVTTAPPATTPVATTPAATTPAGTTPAGTTPAKTTPPATTPTTGKKLGGTLTWIQVGTGPAGPIGYLPEVTGPSGVSPQIAFQPLLKEMLDGSIKPGLASSFSVVTTADNPSITFSLTKGIKFQDGTDFNAKAVKWNLDLVKANPIYAATTAAWKSIEVIDDYTVRVNFSFWQNALVRSFCDTLSYMASPTAFEKNGIEWMRYNMVGTGPFVQKEYRREVTLSGTKNPNYWEAGKPYLDGVKYLFVADELTATALFKSGGGDVLQATNPTVLKDLEASGNTVIPVALGPFTLMPDGANPDSPWSNQKVREATEYALDKEALARNFGYGFKAANQFSTQNSKAYDTAIKGRGYDPAKAKQLMVEAGYPNGFKTQILASPIFLNRDAVVAVASYLSKIGIQAEMTFPGFAQWSDMSTKPWKNGLIWTSINEWGNQNATFNYFLGAPAVINKSVYKPDGYQQLLDGSRATAEADPVMLKKIENMIYDYAMVIPMFYGANNFVFKPYVMDHGEGTRGQSNWFEPQDTWLNK